MEQSLASISNGSSLDLGEGTLIAGKYRIEALLARGGMGVVYRAWQPLLARNVAIKIVRPELMSRCDVPGRFLNEARALAQLQTDHVCRVLDGGSLENGVPYMVLEYLEGADLRNVLNRCRRFGVARAVDLVLQLTEALAEAHAMGIVHRDIKPENLFLVRDPSGAECVKLLDFGICQTAANALRASDADEELGLGSPHYMAPEQISAPHSFDPRLDVWSLGVVLYEMLAGEPPFDGDTATAVCAQVLGRDPVSLCERRPDVPAGLENVIARCLAKEPAHRWAEVAELAEALAPYGSGAAHHSLERVRGTLHASAERAASAPSLQIIDFEPLEVARAPEPPAPAVLPAGPPPAPMGVVVPISAARRPKRTAAKRVGAALLAGAVIGSVAGNVAREPLAHDLVARTLGEAPEAVQAAVGAVNFGVDAARRRYELWQSAEGRDTRWSDPVSAIEPDGAPSN